MAFKYVDGVRVEMDASEMQKFAAQQQLDAGAFEAAQSIQLTPKEKLAAAAGLTVNDLETVLAERAAGSQDDPQPPQGS